MVRPLLLDCFGLVFAAFLGATFLAAFVEGLLVRLRARLVGAAGAGTASGATAASPLSTCCSSVFSGAKSAGSVGGSRSEAGVGLIFSVIVVATAFTLSANDDSGANQGETPSAMLVFSSASIFVASGFHAPVSGTSSLIFFPSITHSIFQAKVTRFGAKRLHKKMRNSLHGSSQHSQLRTWQGLPVRAGGSYQQFVLDRRRCRY
jgi:hypothetical protein